MDLQSVNAEAICTLDADYGRFATVLCVDLDRTLSTTDLFAETLLNAIRFKPWLILVIPLWLVRGKAFLKERLANATVLPDSCFRFRDEIVELLRAESARGRRIVICSGSDIALVRRAASRLDFVVETLGSDGALNLTGRRKAHALVALFGPGGYDYAGNSGHDMPVWRSARRAIVVSAAAGTEKAALRHGNVTTVVPRRTRSIRTIMRALRIHQWMKNILVFVPVVASHGTPDVHVLRNAVLAFLAMSLTASSVYFVNDLADIGSDRSHPSKRNRPFASGELSIFAGLFTAPLLFLIGLSVAALLPGPAEPVLLFYGSLSTAYTFWLKKKMLADAVTLALLYTVRLIEGGVATSTLISPWLLALSLFLFLSLALCKRVAELSRLQTGSKPAPAGRGYFAPDTGTLCAFGAGSGIAACLVLCLYLNSESAHHLYPHPGWLWLLLPLLLNWIGRLWMVTMRGRMTDDPIVYVAMNLSSQITVACCALSVLLAAKCPFGIPGLSE